MKYIANSIFTKNPIWRVFPNPVTYLVKDCHSRNAWAANIANEWLPCINIWENKICNESVNQIPLLTNF